MLIGTQDFEYVLDMSSLRIPKVKMFKKER